MNSALRFLFAFVFLFSLMSCGQGKDSKIAKTSEERVVKPDSRQISKEYLALESHFSDVLDPISSMKESNPEVYWFIVSWMGTNYGTPDWKGYSQKGWMTKTKQNGIDCSGFSRVMQDQVFDQNVRGGSQGILNEYCRPIRMLELTMGDLVFFNAPNSTSDRIVHSGVYLQDGYFVHATSKKSAAEGLGINISHLEEPNWARDYVTGGRVK